MKIFNFILRLVLGGYFVYAAVFKIVDPAGFAKNIGNYQILPHEANNLLAITLPWIELAAGGLLVVGIWKRANALLIAGMLVIFLIAISAAMHRGLNIDCGCTGTIEGAKIGFKKLAEDVAWFAAAVWLTWRERD
jgi:uncharacterized membrane protein YphA (DoxX/SURF4 family)